MALWLCENCEYWLKAVNGIGECHKGPPLVIPANPSFTETKYAFPKTAGDDGCSGGKDA
jgi:hypothetical protein